MGPLCRNCGGFVFLSRLFIPLHVRSMLAGMLLSQGQQCELGISIWVHRVVSSASEVRTMELGNVAVILEPGVLQCKRVLRCSHLGRDALELYITTGPTTALSRLDRWCVSADVPSSRGSGGGQLNISSSGPRAGTLTLVRAVRLWLYLSQFKKSSAGGLPTHIHACRRVFLPSSSEDALAGLGAGGLNCSSYTNTRVY